MVQGGGSSSSRSRLSTVNNQHGCEYTGSSGMNHRKRGLTDENRESSGSGNCQSGDRERESNEGLGLMEGLDESCTFISNNYNNHHHNHHHSSRFTSINMTAPSSTPTEFGLRIGSGLTEGESIGHSEMMRE